MKNSEKIYISAIVVLSIILFLKSKKKAPATECVCPSSTNIQPIYIPQSQQPIKQDVVVSTPTNTNVLVDASVYTGPPKFKVPETTGSTKGYLYYQEGVKFFKINYTSDTTTNGSAIEIQKPEMIAAWKSINPN